MKLGNSYERRLSGDHNSHFKGLSRDKGGTVVSRKKGILKCLILLESAKKCYLYKGDKDIYYDRPIWLIRYQQLITTKKKKPEKRKKDN